ncbi:MAG: dihydropteroate synthase [Myxococcota bacterium]
MIWARPLSLDGAFEAHPLLGRTGLSQAERGLVAGGLERVAVVTGLDEKSREALADVVDAAWIGGTRDTAIIRYSRAAVQGWCAQLGEQPALSDALKRLEVAVVPLQAVDWGGKRFEWGSRTYVMGVVNVTPDSFSDGGKFLAPDAAVAQGEALVSAGADLLDIGGQSTRPGARAVSEQEELDRVLPVVERLRRAVDVPLSIDTSRAGVARAALAAGAALVNDVTGLADDALLAEVAKAKAGACAMHMQGTPETMQRSPSYADVVGEVLDFLEAALKRAEAAGLSRHAVLVDPGIGFGKTAGHNLYLLRRLGELKLLGAPVLVGTSRKSFLGALTGGKEPGERLVASTASAAIAAVGGADMVRVHDVRETKDALAVADAVMRAREGGALFD